MVPDISIIIPNYNGAQYLVDALNSVAAQTLQNWECIVIDDGSTDDSVKIINKFVKADKRFKLIKLNHGGVSVARNAGLDAARGRYIAFLDSDDCYTDYALEMLLHFAATTGADMVGGTAFVVQPDYCFVPIKNASWNAQRYKISNDPNSFLLVAPEMNWAWIWRRIYRRELLEGVRFPPQFTGLGDDLCFMIDVCWRAQRIVEVPNTSVLHRHHDQSLTERPFGPHAFEFFPEYFKFIRDNMLTRYDGHFLRRFYRGTMRYLLRTTVVTPTVTGTYKQEAKRALQESCKYIPMRFLGWRHRILCRFLKWVK